MRAGFEWSLWQSRWMALVAVVASLALAVTICLMATVDVVRLVGTLPDYFGAAASQRDLLRLSLTSEAIKALDSYLLAVILLIFGLGLYELFIDKIDAAEGSAVASRLLLIRSLDDLKHRLANVVLLKLMVTFFQAALKLRYETATDLLELAGGIALMGLALYLTGRSGHGPSADGPA
ncbi:MAG: YqhA family protein [Armatimonadetes bacterium]|nr:YqhA family protein [Armatimonadota bacterium]